MIKVTLSNAVKQDISKQGYKNTSPYKNEAQLNISSPKGQISMDEVYNPLIVTSNKGEQRVLQPNSGTHQFKGTEFVERPLNFQNNGKLIPISSIFRDGGEEVIPTTTINPSVGYWDKVKFTLNPKNWGVPDYTDKGDFNTAYSSARKEGEKEFMWNNQRFNTNYDGTPEQQLKETGITDEQLQNRSKLNRNLTENIYPYSYDNLEKRFWTAGVLGEKEENRKAIDKDPRPYDKEKLDALNLYAGIPQKNNTFRVSNYKPSESKDNIYYYTFNNQDDKFVQNLIDYAYAKSKTSLDGTGENYDIGVKGLVPDQEKNVMGTYKMSTGKDDRGIYVSFYDKWDLSPVDFGKPFEIYDRIYTKDYGDGKQKRMYYTDKELSELDIDKKDFDTLALQRELTNRGYKLPKSTKNEGGFDGIWGKETEQALLDYQKATGLPTFQDGGQYNTLTERVNKRKFKVTL